METSFTIRYTRLSIPHRCRKPRPEECEVEISAFIRDVAAKYAPVAFVVKEYDCEPRQVRLYRGRLYRQVQDRVENYQHKKPTQPLWVNQRADKANWEWRLNTRHAKYNSNGKYWDYGSLEDNLGQIYKNTCNYIIIDGDAYERTGEPYYFATCFGMGRNHGGTGFFIGWADYRDRKSVWGWPASDKSLAIAKGVAIALNRGDTESVQLITNTSYDIQVLMPQCVRRRYAKEINIIA